MDKRVSELLLKKQYTQLSDEWFQVRKTKISASSAASLLIRDESTCKRYVELYNLKDVFDYNGKCCNPYSSKLQYFLDKTRGATFTGSEATRHGQMYESVVTDLYQIINNKTVLEFGLLTHPTFDWLAASPDGITSDGIMLEIKCPYRRKINGIPPLYYYIQVMLQLEVANLDYCDFVEFEFVEFGSEQEWLDDITLEKKFAYKGLFIKVEKLNEQGIINPTENKYIYPNKKILMDSEQLLGWSKWTVKELINNTKDEFKDTLKISIVYWKVGDNCNTRIERDKEWFENVRPVFEKEFNLLKYYKKGENYKKLINVSNKVIGKNVSISFSDDEDEDKNNKEVSNNGNSNYYGILSDSDDE